MHAKWLGWCLSHNSVSIRGCNYLWLSSLHLHPGYATILPNVSIPHSFPWLTKLLKLATSLIYKLKILWARETWTKVSWFKGIHIFVYTFQPSQEWTVTQPTFCPTWHSKDIPQIYWMWVLSVHIRNYKVLLVDGGCQCVNTRDLGFVTYMCSEKKNLLSLYYVPSPCLTREFQNIPYWHCTWLHGVYGLAETTNTMLLQRQPVTNMINTKEIWGLM